MIFTTNNRFAKQNDPPPQYIESPAMTFSNKYRNHISYQQLTRQPPLQKHLEPPSESDPSKKPMKWGQPTWFLFHTLAEKIKPEYFNEIRKDLLNLIYTICSNLPCPNCAKHATQYLNNINFNTITTKDALRLMLHRFHNEVNRRKNFPEFPLDQLTPKYTSANTINIIHHFMPFFEDRSRSMKLIADDLHRSRISLQLKAWFNKNIGCFEL
jgi:hypothetical protein